MYEFTDTFTAVTRPFTFNFLTLGFCNHFIVKEISSEKSVSINFHPRVGFGVTANRFLNLQFPMALQYNLGNVSTFNSKKDMGFTVGLGVEYMRLGLIGLGVDAQEFSLSNKNFYGYQKNFGNLVQPFVNLGMRYFTKGSHAQEVNVKFGRGGGKINDYYKRVPASVDKKTNSYWFELSTIFYIRY